MSHGTLIYANNSSASVRTLLARNLLLITDEQVELQHVGPNNLQLNPEGRYPFMSITGKGLLTQSGAICDYLEVISSSNVTLIPNSTWEQIRLKQIVNIIQCDIHPLQNLPIIKLAINMGMKEHSDTPIFQHPFRLKVLRRGFAGLEAHLKEYNSTGKFCVGNEITQAECYLVPQVRNGIGAGIDFELEFPLVNQIWINCLQNEIISKTLEFVGGAVNRYKNIDLSKL